MTPSWEQRLLSMSDKRPVVLSVQLWVQMGAPGSACSSSQIQNCWPFIVQKWLESATQQRHESWLLSICRRELHGCSSTPGSSVKYLGLTWVYHILKMSRRMLPVKSHLSSEGASGVKYAVASQLQFQEFLQEAASRVVHTWHITGGRNFCYREKKFF